MILNAFNHRDPDEVPDADRLKPERWRTATSGSYSSTTCRTARSTARAATSCCCSARRCWRRCSTATTLKLREPQLDASGELPHMLDFFSIRFDAEPRRAARLRPRDAGRRRDLVARSRAAARRAARARACRPRRCGPRPPRRTAARRPRPSAARASSSRAGGRARRSGSTPRAATPARRDDRLAGVERALVVVADPERGAALDDRPALLHRRVHVRRGAVAGPRPDVVPLEQSGSTRRQVISSPVTGLTIVSPTRAMRRS